MTTSTVTQAGLAVIADVQPGARVAQAGIVAITAIQPGQGVYQAGLIVVADGSPCSTRRCSLWQIDRRDGVVMRFSSHDQDHDWGGHRWLSCGSLNETASEQASNQGSVGSIELTGILDSEHITAEDVYAGRYDDAFFQVWRVSWDSRTDKVERIAAGWAGKISSGDEGFKAEILGPGARLLQSPMLETVQPGCRFHFGDERCTFDKEALAFEGAVLTAPSRQFMYAAIVDPGGVAQWDRGLVRWTYGRNTGEECEVREVHFDTGLIIFEIQPPFQPEAGDTFDLLPGCDHTKEQCKLYDNFINFGGFPDVPGQDAFSDSPDAKTT